MIRHYYYTRFIQFICLNSIISLSYLGISRGDQPYPEVTLKDGSKITIGTYSYSANFIEVDGLLEKTPIELANDKLIEIKLAALEPQKKLSEFRSSIKELKNPNFKIRENGASKLLKIGNGYQENIRRIIPDSLDPEVRWRLRETLNKLPPQNEHALDRVRTTDGTRIGYIKNLLLSTEYFDQSINLSRDEIDRINFKFTKPNDESPDVTHEYNPSSLPIHDIHIDFENSLSGRVLNEGQPINDAYRNLGITFDSTPSYLTITSVVIPGTDGKYSATNNKPLYEGAINGSFIDPITKNKLSVNYIAFNLGLIKPDGVKVSLLDDQNNEISCEVTTAESSQIISFTSKLPIQRFKISPISEVNATLAIADIWFSKPKHKFPLLNKRQKQIELKNGDIIICNDLNITNNLFDLGSKTKLCPNSNFSGEINIPNKDLRSIVLSSSHKENILPNNNFIWCLLNDGSNLKLDYAQNKKPINELTNEMIDALPICSIWASNKELYYPPEINYPKNKIGLYIRKDPIFLNNYSYENNYFIASKDDGTRIKYNYSRIPTIWISDVSKNIKLKAVFELLDGQRVVTGTDSYFKLLSFTEDQVIIESANNKAQIPFNLIKRIKL